MEQKVTVPEIVKAKAVGRPIVALTAYDFPFARIADEAGVDLILVGDSLGMVVQGFDTTLPVTMDEMVYHTRMVARARRRALLVSDLPFLSYQVAPAEAVANAGRLIKEGGAEAVKLEGGRAIAETIERIAAVDIPVMGHIGLTPQSINQLGAYRVQGKTATAARQLIDDAKALEDAGAFAIVLEVVPREIARLITETVSIPTIGIGAGVHCDIQVLVIHDMLGLSFGKQARFVRPYANLREVMTDAITRYADDVRNGTYPSQDESYALPAEAADELNIEAPSRDLNTEKS